MPFEYFDHRIAPLRKIIGTIPHPKYETIWLEVLECGHWQSPVRDIYGETNAFRRRCRKCYRGQPSDMCEADMRPYRDQE